MPRLWLSGGFPLWRSLSLQWKIWLAISSVSLFLYIAALFLMPAMVRGFFSALLLQPHPPPPRVPATESLPPYASIQGLRLRGFTLLDDGTTLPPGAQEALPARLLEEIKQHAVAQSAPYQLYQSRSGLDDRQAIRYAVRREVVYGRTIYQISFLRRAEEEQLVSTLLLNFMLYAGIALVVSWFVSLLIVRHLTRPLVQMESHVRRIAGRDWHEPLKLERGDEIGRLAASIEAMRRQLVKQDAAQQSMLQNISHELKTPVMIIRSYVQAISDGIFPRGDLAGSLQVIDQEGRRLEKLVGQLLYLTRLDYLAGAGAARVVEQVELSRIVEEVQNHYRLQRPEISWLINLAPLHVPGDPDALRVLVENLLDNHLRHAATRLEVQLDRGPAPAGMEEWSGPAARDSRDGLADGGSMGPAGTSSGTACSDAEQRGKLWAVLSVWNDGSRLSDVEQARLFAPFQKGRRGRSGLGLSICRRVAELHGGTIVLTNHRDGVLSRVWLPLAVPVLPPGNTAHL
ncbi:MAG: sensor histidine kinase [Desulfurispora sp.]|uniref:sensor histidine kinase n=1 Tax=Desulfurispora sp. TaxID=3014275 RepID=UPI00404B79A5